MQYCTDLGRTLGEPHSDAARALHDVSVRENTIRRDNKPTSLYDTCSCPSLEMLLRFINAVIAPF